MNFNNQSKSQQFILTILLFIITLIILSISLIPINCTATPVPVELVSIFVYGSNYPDPANGIDKSVYGPNSILYLLLEFNDTIIDTELTDCQSSLPAVLILNLNRNASYYSRSLFAIQNDLSEEILSAEDHDSEFTLSNYLIFIYSVQAGDSIGTLDIGTKSINKFNSIIIPEQCQQTENQFIFTASNTNSISIFPAVEIDTHSPIITNINSRSKSDQTYSSPTVIDILVTFNKKIAFLGFNSPGSTSTGSNTLPTLKLNTGAIIPFMGYSNIKDLTTILFRYKVGPNDNTPGNQYLNVFNTISFDSNGYLFYDSSSGVLADTSLNNNTMNALGKNNRIKIRSNGVSIPPNGYSITTIPLINNQALPITVLIQYNSIFTVNVAQQSFTAELLFTQQWIDYRLILSNSALKYPEFTNNPSAIISQLWLPELLFINIRAKPQCNSNDQIIKINGNNGQVSYTQRCLVTFSIPVNVKNFPFDKQILSIQIRSNTYNNSLLIFQPLIIDSIINQQNEYLINQLSPNDASWSYNNYLQSKSLITTGLNAGYEILLISIESKRISTFNSINILFPLSLLCILLITTFFLQLDNTTRISRPIDVLQGTMIFSFVVLRANPAVSYVTRMTGFIIMTYIFAILTLIVQLFIVGIEGLKPIPKERPLPVWRKEGIIKINTNNNNNSMPMLAIGNTTNAADTDTATSTDNNNNNNNTNITPRRLPPLSEPIAVSKIKSTAAVAPIPILIEPKPIPIIGNRNSKVWDAHDDSTATAAAAATSEAESESASSEIISTDPNCKKESATGIAIEIEIQSLLPNTNTKEIIEEKKTAASDTSTAAAAGPGPGTGTGPVPSAGYINSTSESDSNYRLSHLLFGLINITDQSAKDYWINRIKLINDISGSILIIMFASGVAAICSVNE